MQLGSRFYTDIYISESWLWKYLLCTQTLIIRVHTYKNIHGQPSQSRTITFLATDVINTRAFKHVGGQPGIVNSGAFWAESSDPLWNVVNGFISLVKMGEQNPSFYLIWRFSPIEWNILLSLPIIKFNWRFTVLVCMYTQLNCLPTRVE